MLEFWIDRSDVNVELLDAQLRAAGGDLVYGLSAQKGGVMVYINEAMSSEIRQQLVDIARAHKASDTTPQQQIEAERSALIEEGRSEAPLSADDFQGTDEIIQVLGRKIVWLEQEMRDLRGLS